MRWTVTIKDQTYGVHTEINKYECRVTGSGGDIRLSVQNAKPGGLREGRFLMPAACSPSRKRRPSGEGTAVFAERGPPRLGLTKWHICIYSLICMKRTSGGGQLQIFKAEFFKALAHPVRIRILEILVRGGRSVHELQGALGVDQPTVSQQLAVLRAKNIVDARKEGTGVRYTVRDASVRDLLDVTRRIFDNHLIGTQTMLRELRRESRRR